MKKPRASQPAKFIPPCSQCDALCCRYIAVAIDRPTSREARENVRWFLLHKGVTVFTGHDGRWYLEMATDCRHIGPDGRCTIYARRPAICRQHANDEICEKVDNPYALVFRTDEEFQKHIRSTRRRSRKQPIQRASKA